MLLKTNKNLKNWPENEAIKHYVIYFQRDRAQKRVCWPKNSHPFAPVIWVWIAAVSLVHSGPSEYNRQPLKRRSNTHQRGKGTPLFKKIL